MRFAKIVLGVSAVVMVLSAVPMAYGQFSPQMAPPVCCESGAQCEPGQACCEVEDASGCSGAFRYYCVSKASDCV